MTSEDNSDDNIHLDWRDDEVSLVNNTYKFDAESTLDDDDRDGTYEDDDDDDLDGPCIMSSPDMYPSGNKLRQLRFEDSINSTHDSPGGAHHGSNGAKNQSHVADDRNHITISNSASNSAASRFALAAQSYTAESFEFTPEELAKMLEKTRFELRRERRLKQGDVMKSDFIQNQLKDIRFFPDQTLNKLMSKLLLKLNYVKEALRVTMYIFFDVAMFKEYYVPSPSGPSGISNNKPFPKYERFHAFWSSIHCNDTAFCAKYTKGCIDANSNYRKIALTGGEYTGYVSHRGNSSGTFEVTKNTSQDSRSDHVPTKRSLPDAPSSSSKRFQITLSPTAKTRNAIHLQRTHVANTTNYDSNGHSVLKADDDACYTKDASVSGITTDQFYTPARLLMMKGRAHYMWLSLQTKLLESRDLYWLSGNSMTDVVDKLKNMTHFPDGHLNQLMAKLLNHNITLIKVIKITLYVFYSNSELTKEFVPVSPIFDRLPRPPVSGYEMFHEFWDYLYATNASIERKKRFEAALTKVNEHFMSSGTIPELPL